MEPSLEKLEPLEVVTVDIPVPTPECLVESLPSTLSSEPIKRGRGRPRLSGKSVRKIRTASTGKIKRERTKDRILAPKVTLLSDIAALTADNSSVQKEGGHVAASGYNDPTLADSNVPNPLKVRSISTSFQSQRLMNLLLTNPPLSVEDILKLLPGVIMEQLQGMLDVS